LTLVAVTFVALLLIPVDFAYPVFAVITFLNGVGSGMFAAPNRTAIMNSVPADQRGAASGMTGTFQNAGNSLSIGIFFSLMIAGLANTLPTALRSGLTDHGVNATVADQVAATPPVGSLFAAFLGYNPIESILGPTGALSSLSDANAAALTGKTFFPQLISEPFHAGLIIVFLAAAIMSLIGAGASIAAGGKYIHGESVPADPTIESSTPPDSTPADTPASAMSDV
ncbi:MAG: transporter, partial [Naasia sp.]|nr:transporter [Naasia sp.]